MQIINALLLSTLAGLSTIIGSFIVFFNIKNEKKYITFCLAFTASIMLLLSILELFPTSFITLCEKYSFFSVLLFSILIFGVGELLIKALDRSITNSNNLYKIGILNMIALILHNFPEGITTFITSIHDVNIGIQISIAIMFHNIPEGIAIAAPIYYATGSKKKAITRTLLSGLSEPIGAIFAYLFLKNYINDNLISILLLIVCSIMITLSIEKLIPEALNYNNKKYFKFGIIFGSILILISMILL